MKFEKIKLNTHIDSVGFKYGLVRESNESIKDYRDRLYKCIKEIPKVDKNSFYRSLGYITALKQVPLCKIDKNTTDEVRIIINSSLIYIYRAGVLVYKQKLSELKFFKNLVQVLQGLDYLTVSLYSGDYDFYKVENLLPVDTDSVRFTFNAGEQVQSLPKKYIKDVYDYDGQFSLKVSSENLVTRESNYYLDGNILHKFKETGEDIGFEYEDFPLDLVWSPIKACFVNEDDFNYLLKESIVDNETFGTINNSQEKQTEKLLSQEGSVIINKILEKQNTYWGE